ncbi:MAG TPA: UvrD-helicase domain-containing protein [Streptosporangiaceae bacterium]|jgi:DNA helicase IV
MPSPAKDREIAAEQGHVDAAYVRLEEMRADAQRMILEGYRQALAGTKGSLVDRDAMVYQAALRAQALDIADDGLVFGRLDMTGGEVRYIGRIGVRTRDHDSLVIDWRAPAAEAFYQATPEDPREVVRRRVLHAKGHQVVDLEDDLLDPSAVDGLTIVGDGAFLASLARTRDGTMRDIVATIQREQDEVIRAPADATVLVGGGPGTGKTAVALHRVAYLLFRHQRRFGGRGVLIVGPNRRFTSYIERVLPSLGEGGATLRSLGDLVEGVEAVRHDPPAMARLKGAESMVGVLRRAVHATPPGAPEELRVVYRGVIVRLDQARLERVRRDVHRRRGTANGARPRAADMLAGALWERFEEIGGAADAPGANRREFADHVRDQFEGFLEMWWPIRTPVEVLRTLSDVDRLRRAAGRDLPRDQVAKLAATFASGSLSYQDIALLDELDVLLGAPPRPPRDPDEEDDPFVVDGVNLLTGEAAETWRPGLTELTTAIERIERARRVDDGTTISREYAHIVVDEAQDLSPMQWRMLGRRGRQATWTVVADPAQSAWEDPEAASAAMDESLGRRVRKQYELTTNYRNSVEIAATAARVLRLAVPGARPARAVRATGFEPVVRVVAEPADEVTGTVVDLLGQVEGTIGVIVPVGFVRTDASWADFPDRVQVLDALEVKGLEFDAAVIVSPELITAQSPTGLRTLYVAVSRATQRLTVLTADPGWRQTLSG